MLFNVEKCKVMHMGAKNKGEEYKLADAVLSVVKERDLRVIANDTFKVNSQCHKAAKNGTRYRTRCDFSFECRSKGVIKILYKSLVNPHLEYCVQAWRPHLIKDIEV